MTALHRRPLRYQRLNVPRSAFSAVGIDAYRHLHPAERLATLRQLGHGLLPWSLGSDNGVAVAFRGQFQSIQGELVAMEPAGPGTKDALSLHVDNGETIEVDKLVCATGFITSALSYPLIAQMAAIHDLPTIDGHLAVSDDFTLSSLNQEGSICGVVGALARWGATCRPHLCRHQVRRQALGPSIAELTMWFTWTGRLHSPAGQPRRAAGIDCYGRCRYRRLWTTGCCSL